jgi:hypothetical protein
MNAAGVVCISTGNNRITLCACAKDKIINPIAKDKVISPVIIVVFFTHINVCRTLGISASAISVSIVTKKNEA